MSQKQKYSSQDYEKDDVTWDGCSTGMTRPAHRHSPTLDTKALLSVDSSTAESGYLTGTIESGILTGDSISQDFMQSSSGLLESGDLSTKSRRDDYSRTDSGYIADKLSQLGLECESSDDLEKVTQPDPTEWLDKVRLQAFSQDEDGDTYLHVAIADGFVEAVFSLIRLSTSPKYLDIRNNCWHTSLHIAVMTEQPLIVRRLILSGASLCSRDKWGNTPLHYACDRGSVACVLNLLTPIQKQELDMVRGKHYPQSYQSVDLKNYQGQTCAHLAARRGHYEILKHLYSFGADMNAREGLGGRTPLHYAVQTGSLNIAELLLRCCAVDSEIENYAGLTAYQQAYLCNHPIKNDLARLGSQKKDVSLSSDESDLSDEEDMDADMNYGDIKVSGAPVLTAVSG